MEDDQLIILIKKYLAGNCSPEEKQTIEVWFESQQNEDAVFYNGDPNLIKSSSERSFQIIRAEINPSVILDTNKADKSVRWFSQKWMSLAACLLIFFAIGIFLSRKGQSNHVIYQEVTAASGHVVHIVLEDHTSIWLNAGSLLKYSKLEKNKPREVYLTGEAYFDVKHDRSRPFIVHTAKLATTVLGTAFSVTAYNNMSIEAVTVIRGKVQVSNGTKKLGLLTPDKRIEYDNRSHQGHITDVKAETLMSWKDGMLQFENQDMQDIAARVGRWYGFSVNFKDNKIKTLKYTANFNNRIPLNDLLKVMRAISGINYHIDFSNKTITFLGTGSEEELTK